MREWHYTWDTDVKLIWFVLYIPCLSTLQGVPFKNPWHKVTGAWNPNWSPLTRFSSTTLDLEGLDSQTWYQFHLKLTLPTRLTYPFYDLTPYLMINPNGHSSTMTADCRNTISRDFRSKLARNWIFMSLSMIVIIPNQICIISWPFRLTI